MRLQAQPETTTIGWHLSAKVLYDTIFPVSGYSRILCIAGHELLISDRFLEFLLQEVRIFELCVSVRYLKLQHHTTILKPCHHYLIAIGMCGFDTFPSESCFSHL